MSTQVQTPQAAARGAAAHGGGGHGARGAHSGPKREPEHKHHGPPPWLISFGDMMTLFLCFFIILVTMAPVQESGLLARGLGSFVSALENGGMDAPMDGAKYLNAVNVFRARFGLEPLTAEELEQGRIEARDEDELKQLLASALRPYSSLGLPLAAHFAASSDELPDRARAFLDRCAESLRPGFGQILVLEGHDDGLGPLGSAPDTRLALVRANAVKRYLVEEHQFVPQRIEARAAIARRAGSTHPGPVVEAELVQPTEPAPEG